MASRPSGFVVRAPLFAVHLSACYLPIEGAHGRCSRLNRMGDTLRQHGLDSAKFDCTIARAAREKYQHGTCPLCPM